MPTATSNKVVRTEQFKIARQLIKFRFKLIKMWHFHLPNSSVALHERKEGEEITEKREDLKVERAIRLTMIPKKSGKVTKLLNR